VANSAITQVITIQIGTFTCQDRKIASTGNPRHGQGQTPWSPGVSTAMAISDPVCAMVFFWEFLVMCEYSQVLTMEPIGTM